MSQIQTSHYEGTASTAANALAARKVVIPLPYNGSWTVNGQVQAIDTSSTRATTHQVVFNIQASGHCTGGTTHETDDAGPSGWTTQPAVNPFTGTLVTAVFNDSTDA